MKTPTSIIAGVLVLLPPEIAWRRTVAALDAGHGLHLAMSHIVGQFLVRGAHSIVADVGKLADVDVVVCREVFAQGIGQFVCRKRLAHLVLHLELHIGKAVQQVLVGAEADAADAYILARG